MSLCMSIVHFFKLLSSFPLYYEPQFAYSLVAGHLDCFPFVALADKATVNLHLQVPLWTYAFVYFG